MHQSPITGALDDLEILMSFEEANNWPKTADKIDSIFLNSETINMLNYGRFPDPEMKKKAYNKAKIEALSTFLYPDKYERDIYIKIYEKK